MNARFWSSAAFAVFITHTALAQTMIDLRTQSKGVDHSGARSTKPFKSGSTLPVTCFRGEFFYMETAQPGKNLYACVAANVWTLYSGVPLPAMSGMGILSTDGSSAYWTTFSGDVSGGANAVQVRGIQGRSVAP